MSPDTVKRNIEEIFGLSPAQCRGATPLRRQAERGLDPTAGADVSGDDGGPQTKRFFSPFLQEDAEHAARIASDFSSLADMAPQNVALEQVTARAVDIARDQPLLAQHALGLFATRHPLGKGLRLPSLLRRTAEATAVLTAAEEVTLSSVHDAYPDARAVGYPFDRRLERPLSQIVAASPHMATSEVTIRW